MKRYLAITVIGTTAGTALGLAGIYLWLCFGGDTTTPW